MSEVSVSVVVLSVVVVIKPWVGIMCSTLKITTCGARMLRRRLRLFVARIISFLRIKF